MEQDDNISAGFNLQEYVAILRRRRWIILQAFVLIAVIGVAQALMARNVYQASAKMLVEGPSYNLNTVDSSNPLSSLFQLSQQQTVDTQVEVLQAAPLLDQVEKQVGPAGLTVANVKDTNVIEVTGESSDPKLAAAAPNALLQLYIAQDLSQNLGEMENARRFVEKQGRAAHQRLTATEAALRNFKQNNHVADLAKSRDDQIARVSALTAEAQSEQTALATLRAQIAADRSLLDREPATVVVKTQATNAVLAGLRDDIRKLEVVRVGLIQPGGLTPNAPQVKSIDAQIADLRQRLAEQPTLATSQSSSPDALHETLRAKALDLGAQVAPLQTQAALTGKRLAEAKGNIARQPVLELTQDRLTREHDAAQQQDKNFSDQLADLVLREKAHHAAARVIESASAPTTPVRPHRMQSIIFACLIGLFVGVCLALMQEFLDDRINSADEAGRVLGLPASAEEAVGGRPCLGGPGEEPGHRACRLPGAHAQADAEGHGGRQGQGQQAVQVVGQRRARHQGQAQAVPDHQEDRARVAHRVLEPKPGVALADLPQGFQHQLEAGPRHDHRLADQIPRVNARRVPEPVGGREDHADLVLDQQATLHARRRVPHDPDVHHALRHPLLDLLPRPLEEHQVYVRVLPLEVAQDADQETGGQRVGGPEPHPPLRGAARRRSGLPDRLHRDQRLAGVRQHLPPRPRQRQAPAAPLHQGHPQVALKLCQPVADRRLGQPHTVGGLGEVPRLDERDE